MLTVCPARAIRAPLRAEGLPSGQNGAVKISKPHFNASGIFNNFRRKKRAEVP
jgi:hypothetical protein